MGSFFSSVERNGPVFLINLSGNGALKQSSLSLPGVKLYQTCVIVLVVPYNSIR